MNTDYPTIAKALNPLFKRLPIDVVYLYGSHAYGKNDSLSDYDFGILFAEKLSPKKRFDIRLRLFGRIAERLNIEQDLIDVVDLKEVPVLLQFNVISGKVIYCTDSLRKVMFETYVMARYHDEHYFYDRYFYDTLKKIEKGVYFERRIPYP